MGSASHVQGVPQRPGLASRRDFRSLRERDRERTADIRYAIVVQSLGSSGVHLVKNQCNDVPYRVTSIAGVNFSPGSVVLLGSNSGHPGEVILGGPPPGRRGASLSGAIATTRALPVTVIGDSAEGPYYAIYQRAGALDAAILDADGALSGPFGVSCPTFDSASCFGLAGITGAVQSPTEAETALCCWSCRPGEVRAYNFLTGETSRRIVTAPRYLIERVIAQAGTATWFEVEYVAPDINFYLMTSDDTLAVYDNLALTVTYDPGGDVDVSLSTTPLGFMVQNSGMWLYLRLFPTAGPSVLALLDLSSPPTATLLTDAMVPALAVSPGAPGAVGSGIGGSVLYASPTGIPGADDFVSLWSAAWGIAANALPTADYDGDVAAFMPGRLVHDSYAGPWDDLPAHDFVPASYRGVAPGMVGLRPADGGGGA